MCANLGLCVYVSYRSTLYQTLDHIEFGGHSKTSSGDETPLVILHGLFGSKNNWMTLAKRFASELPYRVSQDSFMLSGQSITPTPLYDASGDIFR